MSGGAVWARELTPPGRGAITVIEVGGPGGLERLRNLARLERLEPGPPRLARLFAGEELLDEALLWVERPDRAELHVHGSPPLVRRLLLLLGPDSPGRGPRLGGWLEERARELLARAASEAAARMLVDQEGGALRGALEGVLSGGEAGRARARELLELARVGARLVNPPLVALSGPANAGKSTLFNLLLGRERAVVSEQEGTTRDALVEPAELGAYAVQLVDAAGERAPRSDEPASERALWKLGAGRAREVRERADLVLWLSPVVLDGGEIEAQTRGIRAPLALLTSRSDELSAREREAAPRAISALRDGEAARAAVVDVFHEALSLPREPWRPGRAVPFDESVARALDDAAGGRGSGALREILAR